MQPDPRPAAPTTPAAPAIRAVIFDIGGVLIRSEDDSARAAREQRLGLAAGELEHLVFTSPVAERAALGAVTEEDVWADVAARLHLDDAQRQQFARDFWAGERLDTTLTQFLRDLRPRYRTAFLSNAWSGARAAHTDIYKIHDAVDVMILSCEVGLAKPDPRIYELAAEHLGVPPAAAVFVDDIERNVLAARAVGMRAIQFHSSTQTMADLRGMLGEAE